MTVETTGSEAEAPTEVMPAAAPRTSWAVVPKVNLLPPEILEVRRFRRVRQGMGVVVLVVVTGVGLATYWAQTEVTAARKDLTAAQSEVTGLQREQQRYAEAPRVIAQVEAAQTARRTAMANDVLWYQYLTRLSTAQPAGVDIETITATVAGAPGAAAPAPSSILAPTGIGTITLDGTAETYAKVASWLESLNRVSGTQGSSLTTAALDDTAGAEDVSFSSEAVITEKALSGRYTKTEKKGG